MLLGSNKSRDELRSAGALRGGWPLFDAFVDRIQTVLGRHGKKLWWFHSVYALTLGSMVVLFAQKGFDHARWLAISIVLSWLLVLTFFRVFGSGTAQQSLESATAKVRVRFFVMTYALKNLYQGMLFFLLPFYWKSATRGAPNFYFVLALALFAFLSTLDIVFDRFVMKRKGFASIFHGVTLFSCLNLVIPALFPDTRTMYSLLSAAGITAIAFWSLHVPVRAMGRLKYLAILPVSIGCSVTAAYLLRPVIPPVPMHLKSAAVGPKLTTPPGGLLRDGSLAMEVKTLDVSVLRNLVAVTDVVVPGGEGDRLHHVWLHDGVEVHRANEETARDKNSLVPAGIVRLRSTLSEESLPDKLAGAWSVDVETEDGQLVGRTTFTVTENASEGRADGEPQVSDVASPSSSIGEASSHTNAP